MSGLADGHPRPSMAAAAQYFLHARREVYLRRPMAP